MQEGDDDALYTLGHMHLERYFSLEAGHDEGNNEGEKEGEEEGEGDAGFLSAELLRAADDVSARVVKPPVEVTGEHVHVHTEHCHHHHPSDKERTRDPAHDHAEHLDACAREQSAPTPLPLPPPLPLSKQHLLRAVHLLVQASSAGQAEATVTLGAYPPLC